MEYKTYIDESGNTGSDLLNISQKIFCLSSVSIPSSQMENLKIYIQEKFESVKEKEEKEISSSSKKQEDSSTDKNSSQSQTN